MNKFQLADKEQRPQFQARVRHYHRHGARVRRLDSRWAAGDAEYGMSRWSQDSPPTIVSPRALHLIAILMAVIGLGSIITEMVIVFRAKPAAHATTTHLSNFNLPNP